MIQKRLQHQLQKHSSHKNIFLLFVKIAYQIDICSHPDFINHWFKLHSQLVFSPSRSTAVPLWLVYERTESAHTPASQSGRFVISALRLCCSATLIKDTPEIYSSLDWNLVEAVSIQWKLKKKKTNKTTPTEMPKSLLFNSSGWWQRRPL